MKEVSYVAIWGIRISDRRYSKCKRPEVPVCLKSSSNCKQARWLLERRVRVNWGACMGLHKAL